MQETVKFTNPEVAEKYEATTDHDSHVTRQQLYSGLLSNITLAMAAAMVKGGNNLIREKKTPTPAGALDDDKSVTPLKPVLLGNIGDDSTNKGEGGKANTDVPDGEKALVTGGHKPPPKDTKP